MNDPSIPAQVDAKMQAALAKVQAAGLAPPIASASALNVIPVANVAAALRADAAQMAVKPATVQDVFDHDVAFKFAFLGTGQGGGRLASAFHSLGYRRVALFNTADSDFQGLPQEISRFVLPIGGAAKDARLAENSLTSREDDLWDLMQRAWGTDIDYAMICAGLGGGTGSGTSTRLVELARKYLEANDRSPRVGAVVSIPSHTEGQQVARNALTALYRLLELKVSPLILVDNAKINQLYSPGMLRLYSTANNTVSQLLHLFNRLAAVHSPLITFDRAELAQLLDNGICVMGAAALEQINAPADVSTAIREQLTNNVLADVELQRGDKGACLFVGSEQVLDSLSLEFFEAGFTQLNRLLRGGDVAVVHRGVYVGSSPGLQAYAMVSGLRPPRATLTRLTKEANIDKRQLQAGMAQFLGLD